MYPAKVERVPATLGIDFKTRQQVPQDGRSKTRSMVWLETAWHPLRATWPRRLWKVHLRPWSAPSRMHSAEGRVVAALGDLQVEAAHPVQGADAPLVARPVMVELCVPVDWWALKPRPTDRSEQTQMLRDGVPLAGGMPSLMVSTLNGIRWIPLELDPAM